MDPTQPSHPDYWNSRYLSGETPWDFGGVPADLQEFLRRHPKEASTPGQGRVLIPGCGSGYEIKAFAAAGYDVTAIDIAPEAVKRARQALGPALASRVLHGDFFKYEFAPASFDIVYERTFLCSLTPDRREAYRDRLSYLLKYGGSLLGYFYYQNTELKDGPPFGFAWGTADVLFSRNFLLTKDVAVTDSLAFFAGRERWQERRRTSFSNPSFPT